MGNETSSLIETAIQSTESGSVKTDDPSKFELYRLLHAKMHGDDAEEKHASSASAANVPKEPVMMAPKKKFLIGYRDGGDVEPSDEKTSSGNPGVDVTRVCPTSSSTSAEVARGRSHTVSLPFRSRGPPQPETARRPLVDAVVSSAMTIRSCIMTAIDSRLGDASSSHVDARRNPTHTADVELVTAARPLDVMTSRHQLHDAARATHHHLRDSAALLEAGRTGRQLAQYVTATPQPASSRYTGQHGSEAHITGARYDPPLSGHPGVERPTDRRFLPAVATDRLLPHVVDHRFTVPQDYWKEMTADDRRKVGQQLVDHREVRAAGSAQHESYMSHSADTVRYVDTSSEHERSIVAQRYMPVDSRLSLLSDHTTQSYSALPRGDFPRGWTGQHLSTDSYRHSSSVVEYPTRESRAARPHYDMGESSRKYPVNEARMSAAVEYGSQTAVSDIEYERRHQHETPVMVAGPDAEHHHCRPHPSPLQPVEPSVRPRIAGLTHGDPAVYEPALPQVDSGRYAAYRTGRYDIVEPARPISDALTQFMPSDQKPARRHSPYHSSSGAMRSLSRTSGLSRSLRGEGVTSECPLDLTVRKEQSMTAEAFLRRCNDPQRQYAGTGRLPTELQYSHHWTVTDSEAFDSTRSSVDVRQRMAGVVLPTESSYPGHVAYRPGDAVRPVHSAVREYPETDVRRVYPQHQRQSDDEDVHVLYSRRDVDPRWESARPPVSSMTASPIGRPSYWTSRSVHTNMENVGDSRGQHSAVGEVSWIGERSQYDARLVKTADTEVMAVDRRTHCTTDTTPALSPQNIPTAAASRRVPMVQLLGGKYSPSDILHLCCKVCGSTYGSLRSFRMHFAKAHGQEPTPENFTIQTISDARNQALSQQRVLVGDTSPPTVHIDASDAGTGRDVTVSADVEQHKRSAGVCEFATSAAAKPRSVAEVQPMQKKTNETAVVDEGASKPSPDDVATKRSGEDRRMKCKKCGQFSTHDLSTLRQHVRSHGDWSDPLCSADDTGCAVCLEGFNDVSDWQQHVTSQHMMRSCICKSCDLGFTNASALRRHLMASHGGIQSPTGNKVDVEYRCLFCPQVFTDEHSLYAHTRAHEQHYSTQRACSRTLPSVQTAVPDTTCPEDQRTDVARLATDTARHSIESDRAKNIEITGYGDVTARKSAAAYDVRLNSRKASILRRLSVETEMTSAVKTSPSSVSDRVTKSDSVAARSDSVTGGQPAPVVFGDLLSSMHREVESTLLQLTSTDTTSSSQTPLTAVTLASSPCVRDVCDAIIVHALRQCDETPLIGHRKGTDDEPVDEKTQSGIPGIDMSPMSGPQRTSHRGNVLLSDHKMHMTDCRSQLSDSQPQVSDSHTVNAPRSRSSDCQSHLTDSQRQQQQCTESSGQLLSESHATESLQSLTSETRQLESQRHAELRDMSQRDMCVNDAPSRLSQHMSHATESLQSLMSETRQLESQRHAEQRDMSQRDMCVNDAPSHNKSLSESDVKQTLSSVVDVAALSTSTTTSTTTTTTTTTTTVLAAAAAAGGGEDVTAGKPDVNVSSHEADDVDMEDQPLLIDLNRDTSPTDNDDTSH